MPAAHASRVTLAVASLCLVQFVDVAGVTIVVAALPRMLADLHAPATAGSLISTAYAMFFGGFLMLGARIGDRIGHRRAISASLVMFAIASVAASAAGSVAVLTAARSGQGAAAAVSVPSALRLLTSLTREGAARRRAIAAWSASGAAAGASGFVIGGVVTDLIGWRVIFLAYVPLAAVLAGLIAWLVPRDGAAVSTSLNVAGAVLLTGSVMALVIGITALSERGHLRAGIGLCCAAALLVVIFIWVDQRAKAPLLPRALLQATAVRLGAFGSFVNTATTSSVMTLATLYLQGSLHRSPLSAAATLLPFSLAVICGSLAAPGMLRRVRPGRVVGVGLAVIGLADASLVALVTRGGELSASVALAGAGIGLSSVAATTVGMQVPADVRGMASGVVNTAAQLGTAVGVAALLLVAAASGGSGPVTARGLEWAGGLAAVVALTTALAVSVRAAGGEGSVATGSTVSH
jgi:MFS family permease